MHNKAVLVTTALIAVAALLLVCCRMGRPDSVLGHHVPGSSIVLGTGKGF